MATERSIERFMEKLGKVRTPAQNVFQHNTNLMENQPGKVDNHDQVFDKQALLAIIKDDDTMRIYQRDCEYLIKLYDMSMRDTRLTTLFRMLRAKFYSELGLTRAMEGEERKHQAEAGGYQSPQDMRGYGATTPQEEEKSQLTQLKELIQKAKRG